MSNPFFSLPFPFFFFSVPCYILNDAIQQCTGKAHFYIPEGRWPLFTDEIGDRIHITFLKLLGPLPLRLVHLPKRWQLI